MDHRSPNFFFRHCLPMTFTMDDNEWVNSEKEACSASFSYWAATGKSTGWNWPLGWKRSNEENRHLPTSFLGLFYPTLKKELKSETMILGGGPCSQSVRLLQKDLGLVHIWFKFFEFTKKNCSSTICHSLWQLLRASLPCVLSALACNRRGLPRLEQEE